MKSLRSVLEKVQKGEIDLAEAEKALKLDYIENLDDSVKLDLLRHHRTGIPEVIFAETKEISTVLKITKQMLEKNRFVLLTRLTSPQFEKLDSIYNKHQEITYSPNRSGRIAFLAYNDYTPPKHEGYVGLITAGSSDIPIAEEARLVLTHMGYTTYAAYDVGIAGMHRIFPPIKKMISDNVDVIICIAGMEGTLPGVVSSLVDVPVIGVPTSIGYGLGAKGIGALTTMLQSCSPGLAVVNIDNGFGAATMAALILKRIYRKNDE
ncbi:MAG: nickel pincer cofactor biosynthesis protein LarB [Promethearchaeota archaeon]